MREISLDELDKKAKAGAEKRGSQSKIRYRYARNLGFSSAESIILQGKKEIFIKKLADERNREST